jgi:hypothetical protein
MTLDDERLSGLSRATTAFRGVPVALIESRAAQVRRARRAMVGTTVAASVVAVAVGVAAVAAPRGAREQPIALAMLAAPPVATRAAGCSGEPAVHEVTPRDVPHLRYALRGAPDPQQPFARAFGTRCTVRAPALVATAERSGTLTAGLAVWGPGAEPLGSGDGSLAARGTTARVRATAPGQMEIAWHEPDGTQWVANASGLGDGVAAALDALRIDDGQVTAGALPAGLVASTPFAPSAGGTYWFAGYGYGGKVLQLTATDDIAVPLDELASRSPSGTLARTRIHGRAALTVDSAGGRCVLWDETPRVRLQLCGKQPPEELVRLATTVERDNA